MEIRCEVMIALPRSQVGALFDDPAHLSVWVRGLESYEQLSGRFGEPGARSRLRVRHGRTSRELIETVVDRQLPEFYTARYEAPGVTSEVHHRLVEAAPDQTRWISENRFSFTGLAALGVFARGTLEREVREQMQRFKVFAEARR